MFNVQTSFTVTCMVYSSTVLTKKLETVRFSDLCKILLVKKLLLKVLESGRTVILEHNEILVGTFLYFCFTLFMFI